MAQSKGIDLNVGATSLGAKESRTALNLRASRELAPGGRLEFTATLGSKRTFNGAGFKVRTGGSDYQLGYRHTIEGGAETFIGLAVADTPAGRRAPYLAIEGSTQIWGNDRVSLKLVGKTAARTDSTLIGTGFRVDANYLVPGLFAEGLWVSGDGNTYSVKNGRLEQRAVYRVGFRPKLGGLNLECGVTNQVGRTTGMSLTPGLGRGFGGYLELTTRI